MTIFLKHCTRLVPNELSLFGYFFTASQGGRLPAHPNVEPVEKTRPAKVYPVGENDVKDYPKYEKIWKEIFGLR